MRELVILFVHALATLARLLGPGGIRSALAESVLVKRQLLILNRSRQRSPNLRTSDRLVAGLCALLISGTLLRTCRQRGSFYNGCQASSRPESRRDGFWNQQRGRPSCRTPFNC